MIHATLIVIDLEGGLVQEVRTSEPNARIVVHDADAFKTGEDPRTAFVGEYDPELAHLAKADDPQR
jgi:hypothetical protein